MGWLKYRYAIPGLATRRFQELNGIRLRGRASGSTFRSRALLLPLVGWGSIPRFREKSVRPRH